jgi:hypothetical protein
MLGLAIAARPIAAASLRVLATEVVGPRPRGVASTRPAEDEARRARAERDAAARPTRP